MNWKMGEQICFLHCSCLQYCFFIVIVYVVSVFVVAVFVVFVFFEFFLLSSVVTSQVYFNNKKD